jgi:hypothetical protein
MPYKIGRAIAYAVLIWVVGFIWGSIVFMVFAGINLVLDLLILVFLLKTGFSYFISLTVWVAYSLLIIVPWLTGRSLQRAT